MLVIMLSADQYETVAIGDGSAEETVMAFQRLSGLLEHSVCKWALVLVVVVVVVVLKARFKSSSFSGKLVGIRWDNKSILKLGCGPISCRQDASTWE